MQGAFPVRLALSSFWSPTSDSICMWDKTGFMAMASRNVRQTWLASTCVCTKAYYNFELFSAHIISDLFSIANGFASFAIKQTCIVLRIAKLKHREGVVFEFDWYFETALQARSHAGEFGGSSPLNFFCTPKFCCAQKNLFET